MTGRPADYCPDCGTATEIREHENRERRYCPSCEQFVWQNPVPVATVVVRDGEEALFIRRAIPPDEGLWDLPGGFLEAEEHPRYGATRELEEETGLAVATEDLELREVGHEVREGRYLLTVVYAVDWEQAAGRPRAGSDAADVTFARPAELTDVRRVAVERYHMAMD